MASITLQVGSNYATGATVSAYPEANWGAGTLPPSGNPQGSATTTATVAADGTVTFTGLAENTNYFAYVSGGTPPYLRFRVADAGGSSQNATTVQPASGALFSVDSTAATATDMGAGGAAVAAGATKLWGFTIRETTESARAVVVLRNGVVGGAILAEIPLNSGEGDTKMFAKPIPVGNAAGVYVQLVSGTMPAGAVFTS